MPPHLRCRSAPASGPPREGSAIDTSAHRLRRLVEVNRSIVGELSLSGVLRRIVEAAREVSGARYAALGVIGSDGLLEQFVHTGMDPAAAGTISHLPQGRGVLGALLSHPEPIRLSSIAEDPRSTGFPAGHPPMSTFLGVPIRSRDAVFGNLYLTDRSGGQDFTDEDGELVLALAATAGIAIENARLYEDSRRRQEWLRASAEIGRELLDLRRDDLGLLERVAVSLRGLADADAVTVALPLADDPGTLRTVVASGGDADTVGQRFPAEQSLAGEAMRIGHGLRLGPPSSPADPDPHLSAELPVGPVMALPLTGEAGARGAVVLGRAKDRQAFTATELEMAEVFAGYAALALELTANRADQQRLTVLEDRDRIARDLHDHVIQRLFATGLSLQGTATSAPQAMQERLFRSVNDLDETIVQIRTSIFALRQTRTTASTLRATVLTVIDQLAGVLPVRPRTRFTGPLDTLVAQPLVNDVEAVLREALTNVAKHAGARTVEVVVEVADGELSVTVLDDGVGLEPTAPHGGLANLRIRAEQHGGGFSVANREEGGLRLRWQAPLSI